MKHVLTFTLLCLFGLNTVQAQLPDGSIAPNWTLTDIDGNTHTLYDYLDQGKMVILEFSATWCGPCWNYMLTGALEDVWEEHGPGGDNTAMIFYIEADQATGMADLLGQTGSSQGNWVEAIPFPIIDLQVGENQDQQYQINYYPTLFAVCSDYSIWELGQVPAATWSSFITSCTLEGTVENVEEALCYGEGSITAGYEGGVAPISYDWSTGATTATISNIGAGEYSVTITESGGKWVVLEDIVVPGAEEPIGVQEAIIEQPLCNGSANGVIDLEMEGGTPGYQYDWSNGSTTEDLTNVPAGSYSVVVTDDNGCTFEEDFVVDEPDPIEVEAEVTPENCGGEDGTITLDITGGVGDYQLSATAGDIFGYQVVNLPEGNVTVYVEDENGCQWEAEYEIGFMEAPEVDIFQGPELNCIQVTTTLTSFAWNGSGDFEYEWYTTNGNIVGGNNQETITVDQEGTYTVIVVDFISGCETQLSYELTADIVLPEANAGSDLPISCEVSQPTIQGSGDPGNSVNWTTANGIIIGGGNTYTPIVGAPGIYTITVVNPSTGCSNTDNVEVINQINPANAAYQYQTSGLTMITTDISTGSNLSGWSWTFGDGGTSNDQSPVHTYAAPGTYEVCLSVQNGCGLSQSCNQVEVTSTGSVLNVDAQISNVLCYNGATGSISIIVNGGSGNYTYVWTGPNGSSYNTPTITDLIAGAYVVVVSDDQGNSIVSGYNVEQPSELLIASSSVVDNLCFADHNGSITVEMTGGVGPYLYSWNGGPQQAENTISQLPSGTFEAVVTDANGCTLLAGPYSVVEPPAISAQNSIVEPLCHGDATGSASISVSGGVAPYSYLWNDNENQTTEATNLLAGEYNVQITDANGCIVNNPIVINQPAEIAVNTTEVHHVTGAGANDGSITITVTGGTEPYLITWSNGGTGTTISGLAPGSYSYTIQDAHGCVLESQGGVIVTEVVSTTEIDFSRYVTIIPNPSDGRVAVEWKELPSGNSSFSLVTIDGRTLSTHAVQSKDGVWDLTSKGLAEGLYVVLLQHEQQTYAFKLIIM